MFDDVHAAAAALKAAEPRLRHQAALYLGEHPSLDACQALLTGLDDPDAQVHEAVIQAIVFQDGPDRVARLVTVLRGDSPSRRNAALSTLIEIGARQPAALTDALAHASTEVRLHVATVLGDLRHPATVAALSERLADEQEFPNVRHAAAQALGKIGDPRAVPELLRAAGQGDFWIRYAAVEALGRLGDAESLPALLALLRQDAWMRPAIVQALGDIGQAAAVPDLADALSDSNEAVRVAAVEALLKIVVEPAMGPGLAGDTLAQLRQIIPAAPLRRELIARQAPTSAYAAHLLGWLAAPAALPDLIEALGQEEDSLRQAAVEALLRYAGDAIPALLAALDHPHARVREGAVELLGMLSDGSVVPQLLAHSADASLGMRQAIVRAVGSLGGEAAYRGLLQALLDEETRDTALGVIGQLRQADLTTYLQLCLYEETSDVRWAAAQALSLIGDEAAVSILLYATRLPAERLRQTAAEALGRVRSNQAVPVLAEVLGDRDWLVRQKAVEALGSIADGRAVSALLQLRQEPEWRVRRALVGALARVGDGRVLPALRLLAEDPNFWVRRAVMDLVAEVKDPRALDCLVSGLADAEPSVRQAALVTLGRRREPTTAPAVAGGLADNDPRVRLAAVRALVLIDPGLANTRLAELVPTERDMGVRQAIADALGELGLPAGVAPLAELLADPEPAVYRRAAEALALAGSVEAVEALAAGLRHRLPDAKAHIQAQLAQLGVPAIRALLTCARAGEPELRAAAAESLGQLGHALALPTLRLLGRDADERVRAAANTALAAIAPAP